MSVHFKYFAYLMKHKYFVFLEGMRLRVPIHRLIIHDFSKFLPSEWFGYLNYFCTRKSEFSFGRIDTKVRSDFDYSWNHHQKFNPHHWQYWLLITDDPNNRIIPLKIPEHFVREMVADWAGAGRAKGFSGIIDWYESNKDRMILHHDTRLLVNQLVDKYYR